MPELRHATVDARQGAYGAEWEIDPQLEIARLTGAPSPDAHATIERFHVHVFVTGAPGA